MRVAAARHAPFAPRTLPSLILAVWRVTQTTGAGVKEGDSGLVRQQGLPASSWVGSWRLVEPPQTAKGLSVRTSRQCAMVKHFSTTRCDDNRCSLDLALLHFGCFK